MSGLCQQAPARTVHTQVQSRPLRGALRAVRLVIPAVSQFALCRKPGDRSLIKHAHLFLGGFGGGCYSYFSSKWASLCLMWVNDMLGIV